jgi:hypothetical protein
MSGNVLVPGYFSEYCSAFLNIPKLVVYFLVEEKNILAFVENPARGREKNLFYRFLSVKCGKNRLIFWNFPIDAPIINKKKAVFADGPW